MKRFEQDWIFPFSFQENGVYIGLRHQRVGNNFLLQVDAFFPQQLCVVQEWSAEYCVS